MVLPPDPSGSMIVDLMIQSAVAWILPDFIAKLLSRPPPFPRPSPPWGVDSTPQITEILERRRKPRIDLLLGWPRGGEDT